MNSVTARAKFVAILLKKIGQLFAVGGEKMLKYFVQHKDEILKIIADYTDNHIDDYAAAIGNWTDDFNTDLADKWADKIFKDFLDGTQLMNAELDIRQADSNLKDKIHKISQTHEYYKNTYGSSVKSGFSGGRGLTEEENNAKTRKGEEFLNTIRPNTKWSKRSTINRVFNKESKEEDNKEEVP